MNTAQESLFSEDIKLKKINFTEINTYLRCKLEYKYRYKPRNESYDPKGQDVYLGRFYHNIILHYLSHKANVRNKYLTKDVLYDKWKKLEKFYTDNFFEKTILKNINLLKKSFLSTCDVLACEYSLKKAYDNFLIKGRVDSIIQTDFGNIIIDFKLNENEFNDFNSNLHRYLQLIIYYFGLKDSIEIKNAKLSHYFINTGKLEMIDQILYL